MKTREEWLEQLPDGWRIAFGNQLVDDIIALVKKHNFENEYEVLQIKEKFGGLGWYEGRVPPEMYIEHCNLMHDYEHMSYRTCVVCGNAAEAPKGMYDQPICDECRDNLKRSVKIEN